MDMLVIEHVLLFAENKKVRQIGKELLFLNIKENTFTKPEQFRYMGHLGAVNIHVWTSHENLNIFLDISMLLQQRRKRDFV